MAAPITHVVLSDKIFSKFFKDKIRKHFFIGTLFPDIRYLKVIDRDKTHFANLLLADLRNTDSFLAGVKFHSILDIAREKFIVENDVYSLCPESKYIIQSLKILEDEIFYRHIKNWQEYIDYLDEILPDEINFGVEMDDLQRWHGFLQQYFKKQPKKQTVANFSLNIGFSNEIAREMNENVAIMKENKKIIDNLENLYRNFDSLVM